MIHSFPKTLSAKMHLPQNPRLSHKHSKGVTKHPHTWWDWQWGWCCPVPLGSAERGLSIQLVSHFTPRFLVQCVTMASPAHSWLLCKWSYFFSYFVLLLSGLTFGFVLLGSSYHFMPSHLRKLQPGLNGRTGQQWEHSSRHQLCQQKSQKVGEGFNGRGLLTLHPLTFLHNFELWSFSNTAGTTRLTQVCELAAVWGCILQ